MSSKNEGSTKIEGNHHKRKCCSRVNHELKKRIPIMEWLPKYKWKKYFVVDFLCGFTLACIHVPQSLAFSMLASVDLVYGLYTTCFTGLVYSLFGTAPISSFGPVAIGSIITGEAVHLASGHGYSNNEIATTVTFLIGLVYLFGFFMRFGILTVVFRPNFVSPFMAGCTCHIIAKSLKLIFGIRSISYFGMFNFPLNLYSLYEHFDEVHLLTCTISAVVLLVFLLNMFLLKPFIGRYTKIIIPIEAITMLVVSLVSLACDLEREGVPVVGFVPTGLPEPSLPKLELTSLVLTSALTVGIINFSSSISMTILFNDRLNPDQEMFAMAVANLVCSNFQCITIGNSMMRTRVAVTLGMKTLMSTIVASSLMFFVLLFAGPYFQPMPTAVLGCIIVLSTSLLLIDRIRELRLICNTYWNMFMYVTIFLTTLIAEIQYGLLVGFMLSLKNVLQEVPEEESRTTPLDPATPEAQVLLPHDKLRRLSTADV